MVKTIPNTGRARLVVCSLYPMCDVSVTYMLSVFSAVAIIVACRAMSQLPDDDWYQTDHWRMPCCIWYTEEVSGRGVYTPSPVYDVPNARYAHQ